MKQRVFARRKVIMLLSCVDLGRSRHAAYRSIACVLKSCCCTIDSHIVIAILFSRACNHSLYPNLLIIPWSPGLEPKRQP
jgi:hypothetical protein